MARCPFPFELDVTQITNGFLSAGLIGHGLVAVLVVPTGEQRHGLVCVSLIFLALFDVILYTVLHAHIHVILFSSSVNM